MTDTPSAGDRNLALSAARPDSVQLSSAALVELATRSAVYATKAFGAGTQKGYRSAWRSYTTWCAGHGLDPFSGPTGALPLYVTHLADAGRAVSTIRVALAGIATAYRMAGHSLDLHAPQLAPVIEGVTRTLGTRPRRQAVPAVPDVLRALLAECGDEEGRRAALSTRNRAMLLLGFGGAMRRSELVSLVLGDIKTVPDRGIMLTVRRSKTDQQAEGAQIAIWANFADPGFCPALALEAWLVHRREGVDVKGSEPGLEPRISTLPLFCAVDHVGTVTGRGLSDKAVVRLVKDTARAAGMDATLFSGHSLRAGLITAAGEVGADLPFVMRHARQKDPKTTLGYLRPADLWRNNVTARIFKK